MNKILLTGMLAGILAFHTSCNTKQTSEIKSEESYETNESTIQTPIDSTLFAAIKFDEREFSFGDAAQGQVLTHTFAFTNTGKSSLLIQNAVASCGCTVPQWPKESVAPGQKGSITVEFNSKNMTGQVKKTVTVTANTLPPTSQVSFTANILEAK